MTANSRTLADLLPGVGDVLAVPVTGAVGLEHPLEVEAGALGQVAPAEHVHARRVHGKLGAHPVAQLAVRQPAPRAGSCKEK